MTSMEMHAFLHTPRREKCLGIGLQTNVITSMQFKFSRRAAEVYPVPLVVPNLNAIVPSGQNAHPRARDLLRQE